MAALLLPSSAFAASGTNAPPGNSGVDEYVEAIPDATGNKPAKDAVGGGAANGSVPSSVRRSLSALGADGRAVAGLVAATAPKAAKAAAKQAGHTGEPKGGSSKSVPAASGSPAIGRAAVDTVSGSGGMGLLLPIALAGILLAGIAAPLIRRVRS